MRTVPAVLVAAMLVLSGCGTLLGGGGAAGPGTTSPSSADAVPGVTDGRLTDHEALLSAHVSELNETGFETRVTVNATELLRGEAYESTRRQQTVVEPGGDEYVYRLTDPSAGVRFDTWGNDSLSVTRARVGNDTQYRTGAPQAVDALATARVMATFLNATAFEVQSVEEGENITFVTLVSTGTPSADTVGVVPRNATDVRNYQARIVVDTTGRVLVFGATADYTIDGNDGSMSLSHEVIRDDRPSVERPSWAREALAGS